MSKIIILLLISFPVFACDTRTAFPIVSDNIHTLLDWWGATDLSIANSPCLKSEENTLESMKVYLKKPEGQFSENISGVQLENENPILADLLKNLLTNKASKTFTVSPTCKKAICAAEEIFGEGNGIKLLYALSKYGFNLSQYPIRDRIAWKSSELDTILETFDDLPETLLPFNQNFQFSHYKNNFIYADISPNAVAIAEKNGKGLTFFDSWNTQSAGGKSQVIVHEIGHALGDLLKLDTNAEWNKLGGWEELAGNWSYIDGKIISDYGKKNPLEDFAETIVAYRYNADHLKEFHLEKYNFIKKNVFQGVEYLSDETCNEKYAYINKLITYNAKPKLNLESGIYECSDEFTSLLKKDSHLELMRECLQKKLNRDYLTEAIENNTEINNDPKLKNTILNTGLNYLSQRKSFTVDNIKLKEAYVHMAESLMNDFVDFYENNFGSCNKVSIETYSHNIFYNSSTSITKYNVYNFHHKPEFSKIVMDLCQKYPQKKELTCSDVISYFKEMIPKELKDVIISPHYISNDCSLK